MGVTREKLSQAAELVAQSEHSAWLVFARETSAGSDPCLPLILTSGLVWQSALLIDQTGRKVAIVGNYDADPIRDSGDWDEIVPYVEDIRPALLEQFDKSVPPGGTVALNYSDSDDKCDGLTHGLWLALQAMVEGTRFAGCFRSAEDIVGPLRSRKTPTEIALMQDAISEGDRIFDDINLFADPGITERQVFDYVHTLIDERNLGFAWDSSGDPIVNSGPNSMVGHGIPSAAISITDGHVFHIDLGVMKNGYCSDVQRCWFVGDAVPDDVEAAFRAVIGAIDAGAAVLKPGVQGWEVDAAARAFIVEAGYEEYMHALGHQVGRMAHDGGTILGPRWARYGKTPFGQVRTNEVYTLELGVMVEGRGYLGIEEMVRVTEKGPVFLTQRQTTMPLLGYS